MPFLKYLKSIKARLILARRNRHVTRPRSRGLPYEKEEEIEGELAKGQPVLSESHGEEPTELDRSLWDLFTRTASLYPERDALISLWQPASRDQSGGHRPVQPLKRPPAPSGSGSASPSECLRWTYRDLHTKAERLAHILETQHGCSPGMQLAVILWNCAEWGLFFWAAAKLGMTFVPIDPRAADDVPFMLDAVRPRVLVVQDVEASMALAKSLSASELSGSPVLRVHCSDDEVHGSLSLKTILSSDSLARGAAVPRHKLISSASRSLSAPAAALIVFTSGTTARPKGCPHTTRNLVSQTTAYDPHPPNHSSRGADGPRQPDRWLVHTPVSHIFAINNALRAWRLGDTVLFPSRAFSVDSTAAALVQERCTIMSATPTLVKALMSHRDIPRPSVLQEHLSLVTIAGTMISAEDIRLCREGLGARDAIEAFGMTEGAPLLSWNRQDPLLTEGYHPGVGKALPGTRIRICRPGETTAIPRTQVGELHVGGSSVISEYLTGVETDMFYDDNCGRWLRTGDQAKMTEQGVVHILGRYKDLIIRGGENINPLAIEKVLNTAFPELEVRRRALAAKSRFILMELTSRKTQVVGAYDDIAGQVPVAIIKHLPVGVLKAQLIKQASVLGTRHALAGIYTLRDLGIEKIPCTSLGKPKKVVLAALVAKHRLPSPGEGRGEITDAEREALGLGEKLMAAWEQVAGIRPSRVENVLFFADSITLLRFCDAAQRCCGRQIYLEDLRTAESVEKLAALLLSPDRKAGPRVVRTDTDSILVRRCHVGKPEDAKNEHSSRQDDLWKSAEARLAALGLCHNEIEDMIPVRYALHRMVFGQRPQSYHIRIVFHLKSPSSYERVYRGLSLALASWPLMRTMLVVRPGEIFQAVISVNDHLLGRLINFVEVQTDDEARVVCEDSSLGSHPREFMFRAVVIHVKHTGKCMLALTYNHAIVDALSLTTWHRDLDRSIHDEDAKIPGRTPYRLFANLFSQYQDSAPGREATEFHAQRLRGISRHRQALWPLSRAPGFFISDDSDTLFAEARRRPRADAWNNEWEASASDFRFPRRSLVVHLPDLPKLREAHGIEPALFAMCALAVFNVLQTRSQMALFTSWESGRSWPFIPPWMESSLPPATSIDGATFEWILNMMEVHARESLVEFLRRMSLERQQILGHVHAPWEAVLAELREEAAVAEEATLRQSFVWDVSVGMAASRGFLDHFEALQPSSRYDWPDCGFFWNAFMLDETSLFFIASWDTAQMNVAEVDSHCASLGAVMRDLATNQNWDKEMGEVFQGLRS